MPLTILIIYKIFENVNIYKNKKQSGQYLSEREVLLSAEKPSFS